MLIFATDCTVEKEGIESKWQMMIIIAHNNFKIQVSNLDNHTFSQFYHTLAVLTKFVKEEQCCPSPSLKYYFLLALLSVNNISATLSLYLTFHVFLVFFLLGHNSATVTNSLFLGGIFEL